MDNDIDNIEEEIRRLRLASQSRRTDSAADDDIVERIRCLGERLREEKARQSAMLERLRAENKRMAAHMRFYDHICGKMAQEIEEYNRNHLPPPHGDKKT